MLFALEGRELDCQKMAAQIIASVGHNCMYGRSWIKERLLECCDEFSHDSEVTMLQKYCQSEG